MRNALIDRLGPSGDAAYRLEIELDDDIASFGIRGDSAATRERRTLRARYRLVAAATGQTLLDATAGADAGIDVFCEKPLATSFDEARLMLAAVEKAGIRHTTGFNSRLIPEAQRGKAIFDRACSARSSRCARF